MADNEESSVLFSLKELMNLEEDRIKTEEGDRVKAQEEAERARLDAERRAREAEEARIRGEEERRRQEEQRTREEQARLDAIRHAEVEKARAESEQRARMEEIARQQEHERQLTALKEDQGKKRLRNLLFGLAAVVVLAVGAGGYIFWDTHQKQIVKDALVEADKQKLRDEADAAKKKLAANEAQQKELESQLANAADPEEKKRLEAKIAELQGEQKKLGGPGGFRPGTGGGATPPPPTTKKACRKGDPLCDDLK